MTIEAGTRVTIIKDVENFPTIWVKPGEAGTFVNEEDGQVFVRLDKHYPELEEWDNRLQISLDTNETRETYLRPCP